MPDPCGSNWARYRKTWSHEITEAFNLGVRRVLNFAKNFGELIHYFQKTKTRRYEGKEGFMNELTTKNKSTNSGTPPVPFNIRLGTIKSTRSTFARVIRAYADGTISDQIAKNLSWMIGQYTNILKLENEQDNEERLLALEIVLKAQKEITQ